MLATCLLNLNLNLFYHLGSLALIPVCYLKSNISILLNTDRLSLNSGIAVWQKKYLLML